MTRRDSIIWQELDSTLADYGAQWGARHGRNTLLELPSGTVAIVGYMSCANRASAEQHARLLADRRSDWGDRKVTRATFESWLKRP